MKKIQINDPKKADYQNLFGELDFPSEVEDEPDEMIKIAAADLFSEVEEPSYQVQT